MCVFTLMPKADRPDKVFVSSLTWSYHHAGSFFIVSGVDHPDEDPSLRETFEAAIRMRLSLFQRTTSEIESRKRISRLLK